ncbi:E3 ubiquitin-protein ligase HUWE1-like [Ammospiza maritima maritima]
MRIPLRPHPITVQATPIGHISRDFVLPSGSALPRSCPPAEERDPQSREIWSRTQPALSREPRAPPPFPPLRQRPRSPRPPSPTRGGAALPVAALASLSFSLRAPLARLRGPRCRQRLARSRSHQRAAPGSLPLASTGPGRGWTGSDSRRSTRTGTPKMKVDRTKLKKTPTEAPADCRALIEKLKSCSDEQLVTELQQIKTWNIGKCELYHWVDLLDRFDALLAEAGRPVEAMSWMLACDRPERQPLKALLLALLNFTALLIEYSFSRHLYSSIEHLTTLLASSDMHVVLAVLNLLYVFSKRSNYITRLGSERRGPLLARLQHLAESWGGKENGFGLAECCRDLHMMKYPPSATTLHFEFYAEPGVEVKVDKRATSTTLHYIHIEQLDKISESPSEIMESLTKMYSIPKDKQMLLFTHIRLAHGFSNHKKRLQAVQARLHAISILVYSNALQESANSILYNGLIEELVDVLQITDKQLMDIKAASLRTLTSIVHLERTPKLSSIIDCTGTASYHGFLPVLVRNCIQAMIDPSMEPYPHQFATALFSFLYHLASYDAGGEALVSCGMMEALLKVIKFLGDEQDQITFVTRAVRVVDLITNLDMAAFQSHSGLSIFIYRLEHEVDLCRRECPFVIKPKVQRPPAAALPEGEDMETDMEVTDVAMESSPGPSAEARQDPVPPTPPAVPSTSAATPSPRGGVQCIPQRAALLKSMLNFLKKAIQDPAFSDGIRHVMDGSLPTSLKHIISNAEYYGPSLFLLATEVVTVFVFQEPSLLSSLQDNGLTDVMLHALLIKDVPATREVLGSLPNVFSALCLNARGLQSFVQCQPFERLFKVLLSPDYLPAMRRRRSSDPLGDTASNLGSAVDELMRHQPTLKTDATTAIIKLLEEICSLGRDPKYICQKPSMQKADGTAAAPPPRSPHAAEEASSEDEEEEEVQAMQSFGAAQQSEAEPSQTVVGTEERIPIPLMDYILNVMKFVESILSNNTTDDHCQEFVAQRGLRPLVTILGLPNLPVDFPTSAACQAVAGVCKSILTLSHEPKVLQEGLVQLEAVLSALEPLHRPIEAPGGSVLLRELAGAGAVPDATLSAQATPLLHALTAAHAFIMMFVHTCRVGQSEIRAISVNQWGSQLGLSVLGKLSQLYCSLVWESTVLLSLCTPNSLPPGCEFGQADMQKLVPKEEKTAPSPPQGGRRAEGEGEGPGPAGGVGSDPPPAQGLLEGMGLEGEPLAPMETDEPSASDPKAKAKITPAMAARIKQIKPLLSASSRLGRALAELFGLLVKLCVGSPVRQRRSHHAAAAAPAPTAAARATASALTRLLTKGLSWQPPPYTPTPRFRLTFFICSVGFTSPMLFDERKFPYHLMLQKFLCSGGHNALFETFNWALSMGGKVPVGEGLEHPDLPDGTGEFLDAWLMLVEKMVNPSTVLESPHALPAKAPPHGHPPFSALRFLVVTQKAAFACIKQLWQRRPLKVYGGRMAESMLAILCHILRAEPLLRERLGREREGPAPDEPGGDEGGARREPHVNQQQLQQLMDMGFSREHAMEALLNTNTMEQATEYLLTHPPPLMGGSARDLSMSEEDQMMRAIAMSLGQDIPMEQRAESPEEAACRKEEEERRARERQEEEEAKCLEKFEGAEPLEAAELGAFTDSMLPGCSQLLDELPDTVYRVCDLLMTAVRRNGPAYRDSVLKQVVQQVWEAADVLIKAAVPLTTSDTKTVSEWISQMATLPQASNLATRILLLTLLFEELKLPCARVVESSCVLDVLIKLLEVVQPCLQAAKEHKEVQTPKWITPVLLLIDFYEKTAVSSKRRAQMNKYLQATGNNWRWFDDRSGRWCSYSASNNSTIDAAWRAGEPSVRFTAGRRRYTVQFTTMVQVNEETGNRRPVMLTLLRPPRAGKGRDEGGAEDPEGKSKDETPAPDPPSTDEDPPSTTTTTTTTSTTTTPTAPCPSPPCPTPTPEEPRDDPGADAEAPVRGLAEEAVPAVLRACVSMLGVPVDPDTLHATLRLCLRLTRQHKHALLFAELRSTRTILALTQSSGFTGFTPLVTLLFRHIIEDPCTLRHTMEKVVRSAATSGAGSTTSGVVSGSLGSREVNYILRVLGPAACRSPNVFTEVATGCIRIALPAPRGSGTASDDEFENLRIKGPNAVQLVKTTPAKAAALPPIPEPIRDVIYDMLNALAAYHAPDEGDKGDPKSAAPSEVSQLLSDIGDDMYQQYRSLTRPPADFDPPAGFAINAQVFAADGAAAETPPSGTPQGEASSPEEGREGRKEKEGERGEERGRARGSKPLMPTSTILRLLAELVRSYVGIAALIANYSYSVGQSELIKEDCSVLAFVLDHLLPHQQNAEDKDTPALARLFLASLAAAGSGTDAQVALVNEVKAALGRALAMAESTEKHARLQAVMCIISTIMESCPSTSSFYSSAAKPPHNGMNNIIRLFLKKGLVNDLARVPHSLDLSSPNMANTVNAALKPLETLSRIVNQPSGLFGAKGSSSKSKAEGNGGAREAGAAPPDGGDPGDPEPPEEDAEAAQAEAADGDMDGEAEGDTVVLAGQPEGLSTQEMQVENELEDLIDELLERDGADGNSAIIVSRSAEDESQEDVLMDEAPSNLSQASTLQANREDSMNILDPEDEEEHTQEEDSSGSNEDEDDSQDEEEEEEEEDEDDQDDEEGEEGEEEEDDDDGSEMELDEDYPDMNASPLVRFERFDRDDDLIIEFDNMFSSPTDIPPSPGNIPASHPLLVRHAEHGGAGAGGRPGGRPPGAGAGPEPAHAAAADGQRRAHHPRALPGGTAAQPAPDPAAPPGPLSRRRHPAVEQQPGCATKWGLLGPSGGRGHPAAEQQPPAAERGRARLLVGNEDVHIIARSDDELLDDFFHEQGSAGSQAGTLSSIPTALTRWTEECKVLDAESMHDCVSVVKVPILAELDERREKRRRQAAEDEAKGAERGPEDKDGAEAQQDAASKAGPASADVTPPEHSGTPGETPPPGPHRTLPPEHEGGGPGRPPQDAEATQMELSPAPTITSLSPERAEDSDALTAVSSQLEGSPMDTSSLASCTLEESGGASSAPTAPQNPPGTPQGPPPAPPDTAQPPDDSSPPASSSESSSTRDSAGAISGADSRGILEEPLPSTSSEEEDPLAGISLPEGVDPSFLAALPDDIRREVLQNQLGIRPPARAPPAASPAPPVVANPGLTEVSPEFLAALPPAIQEEVGAGAAAGGAAAAGAGSGHGLGCAHGPGDVHPDAAVGAAALGAGGHGGLGAGRDAAGHRGRGAGAAARAGGAAAAAHARAPLRPLQHLGALGHPAQPRVHQPAQRQPGCSVHAAGSAERGHLPRGGHRHPQQAGGQQRGQPPPPPWAAPAGPRGSVLPAGAAVCGRAQAEHEPPAPRPAQPLLPRSHAGLGGAQPPVHPAAQQRERAVPRDPSRDPRPGHGGAAAGPWRRRRRRKPRRARLGRGAARAGPAAPHGVAQLRAALVALGVHGRRLGLQDQHLPDPARARAQAHGETRGGRRLRRAHPPAGRARGVPARAGHPHPAGQGLPQPLHPTTRPRPCHRPGARPRPPQIRGQPLPSPTTPPNPTSTPTASPPHHRRPLPIPAPPVPIRLAVHRFLGPAGQAGQHEREPEGEGVGAGGGRRGGSRARGGRGGPGGVAPGAADEHAVARRHPAQPPPHREAAAPPVPHLHRPPRGGQGRRGGGSAPERSPRPPRARPARCRGGDRDGDGDRDSAREPPGTRGKRRRRRRRSGRSWRNCGPCQELQVPCQGPRGWLRPPAGGHGPDREPAPALRGGADVALVLGGGAGGRGQCPAAAVAGGRGDKGHGAAAAAQRGPAAGGGPVPPDRDAAGRAP